jgi:hypothetical protein
MQGFGTGQTQISSNQSGLDSDIAERDTLLGLDHGESESVPIEMSKLPVDRCKHVFLHRYLRRNA